MEAADGRQVGSLWADATVLADSRPVVTGLHFVDALAVLPWSLLGASCPFEHPTGGPVDEVGLTSDRESMAILERSI